MLLFLAQAAFIGLAGRLMLAELALLTRRSRPVGNFFSMLAASALLYDHIGFLCTPLVSFRVPPIARACIPSEQIVVLAVVNDTDKCVEPGKG